MTSAEREYMDRMAGLGCYLCRHLGYGYVPAQIHHIRAGQGMAQRASNWLTVPICPAHHANSSPDGIHGQRRAWKLAGVGEIDALAWTIEQLQR